MASVRESVQRAASISAERDKIRDNSRPPQPPSSPPPEPPMHGPDGPLPRTWREAVPYVVWVVLVLGFGLEIVSAFVHGQWAHFGVAAVGLVVLMTAALHWKQALSWGKRLSPNAAVGILALVLLSMALSPFIEERRWPAWFQSGAQGLSADEIAAAVVKAIPKQNTPSAEEINKAVAPIGQQRDQALTNLAAMTNERNKLRDQLAAIPKPAPYVNPFRDPIAKWSAVEILRSQIRGGGLNITDCRMTIVQTPTSYAEDFAADFKRILDVIDWKYEPRLATVPVYKGISVLANNEDPKSKACADSLVVSIRNVVRNDPHRWFSHIDVPEHLKACPSGCIEVDFGIEENQ
jgi:hypothetical protein